jgi:hypothetical protein
MPETTTIELLPPAESAEAEAEDVPAPTEAVEQSPEEPPAAAPKKRGRPAGAKNKAKPATTVSTPPVAPVAPVAEIPEIELPPPAPKAKAKTKAKAKPKARSEPVHYESESEEESPTPRTARRNAWSAFREHQAFEHAARRDAFERRISMFMN